MTGALLVLWAVVTIGAPWIAGPIAAQVERVEVALGFDVLPGHANKDDDP